MKLSTSNFWPALTYFELFTERDSPNLFLYKGKENKLTVEFTISGLRRRFLPIIHEDISYIAIFVTLLHQFGGKETNIVRRYAVEYNPEIEPIKDSYNTILDIPIDDDFGNLDFVTNFYKLEFCYTNKRDGELGFNYSLEEGKFFETKVPFVVLEKEKENG